MFSTDVTLPLPFFRSFLASAFFEGLFRKLKNLSTFLTATAVVSFVGNGSGSPITLNGLSAFRFKISFRSDDTDLNWVLGLR